MRECYSRQWTVNDEAAMKRYLDWGVVSITTDKPKLMTKILEERKRQKTLLTK